MSPSLRVFNRNCRYSVSMMLRSISSSRFSDSFSVPLKGNNAFTGAFEAPDEFMISVFSFRFPVLVWMEMLV